MQRKLCKHFFLCVTKNQMHQATDKRKHTLANVSNCCGCLATKLCLFCDPRDCSQPGPSVHGISQARVLEWIVFPSLGDLLDPGISCIAGGFFTAEPPGKPMFSVSTYLNTVSHYLGELFTIKFSRTLPNIIYLWHYPEKAMATHSSTLAWKIPWRSLVGCSPWGR